MQPLNITLVQDIFHLGDTFISHDKPPPPPFFVYTSPGPIQNVHLNLIPCPGFIHPSLSVYNSYCLSPLHNRVYTNMLKGSFKIYSDKSFLTMVFNYLIIRIMISLVGLKITFRVCITIRKIPNIHIWTPLPSFLELSSVTFSLFFMMFQSHIPHSTLPNVSEYL